jgi:hypothetical protein
MLTDVPLTASVTITEPTATLGATTTQTDVLCFGNSTGAIDLTINGGTAPYAYLWSNGSTSEDLSNVAAGTYSVTITDANGCSMTSSVTIAEPAATLAASTTQTDVLCFGNSSGAVDLSVVGGAAPYTYLWSNGATTEDLSNVAAGTYNVTITDGNGCTITSSVTITEPTATLGATTTQTDVLCFGNSTGAIDLTINGGTAPYAYLWSNGSTSEDLTNIAAGTYDVTITDGNGCTITSSVTITEPTATLGRLRRKPMYSALATVPEPST